MFISLSPIIMFRLHSALYILPVSSIQFNEQPPSIHFELYLSRGGYICQNMIQKKYELMKIAPFNIVSR